MNSASTSSAPHLNEIVLEIEIFLNNYLTKGRRSSSMEVVDRENDGGKGMFGPFIGFLGTVMASVLSLLV